MLRYIKETGVNAIGIDYTVSCEWAHKAFEKKIPIQGNLSPRLLAENSEGAVREIRSITKCFSDRPHIVNLGHGILPETPIENVHAMINAVRQKSE